MKAAWAIATVGLCLLGPAGPSSAQPYGGPDFGYGDRGYREREYRDRDFRDRDYRDRGYRDRDDDYRDRDRGRSYGGGFDEREYLRCNPDVRRAVDRGDMESGLFHYRQFGRRENRRLSC